MKLKCTIILMVGISLILQGCEEVTSQPPNLDKLSLITFFSTKSAKQNIFLYKTAYLDEKDSTSFNDYFVENAVVKIIRENRDTMECILTRGDKYRYSFYNNSKENQFKPGETYKIIAESEPGLITGETTFPGDYKIIYPEEGDFYFSEEYRYSDGYKVPLNIQWTRSKDAFGYFIEIAGETGGNDYFTYDTTFTNDFYLFSPYIDSESFKIIVTAIDINYYRHHFQQYNSAGISGGFGVMSSGTVKELQINFIKKNP